MAGVKPDVDHDAVASLLEGHFDEPVSRLKPIEGGHVARTFSFAVGDAEYVVRFNRHMGANFEKEAFIAGRYASPAVPIPRIVHLGRFGDIRYAVSEKVPGSSLDALPPAEVAALVPALLDTLDAVHAADVAATMGFGVIGDDGNGLSSSWRDHLASVREPGPDWDFYGGWQALFETSFLDRAAFDQLYGRMADLLPFCPEHRFLVHGSFGFGNVLAAGRKITAVLDWIDAAYGDFLYDVAWLDFWSAGMDVAGIFRRHYADRGVAVPGYDERLRCYEGFIGLDASRFYAKAGDERSYRWLWDRLRELDLDGA